MSDNLQPEVVRPAVDENRQTGSLRRRDFLLSTGMLAATGSVAYNLREGDERGWRADVMVASASSYSMDLARVVRDGLAELGLGSSWAKGKSVLLKPNLVEPQKAAPHINTHPALVAAVADVFRSWGAKDVLVAEGPGHCRDTEFVLEQSGLDDVLQDFKLDFVDLNTNDVETVANRFRKTRLKALYLPQVIRRADIVVSMPKMKTHHWVGVTLAMKNLFGVMPGMVYGWPKNVLHQEGIPNSILDINAAVKPSLAIVDGIVGMEGDGPIMGSPKAAGLSVMGTNLLAVDAPSARLMGIDPWKVSYLAGASGRLGPISDSHIRQRGETIAEKSTSFAMLDHPSLSHLKAGRPKIQ